MDDAALRHYRFESYCLDTQTRELRQGDGTAVALTAKAFETLRLLIENRHRVVGKDELLAAVWAGRVVEENNLTQAVSALRRALGAGAGDHRYIVTVPGRGYQFVAVVACTSGPWSMALKVIVPSYAQRPTFSPRRETLRRPQLQSSVSVA